MRGQRAVSGGSSSSGIGGSAGVGWRTMCEKAAAAWRIGVCS
jgi:hypothetical protein